MISEGALELRLQVEQDRVTAVQLSSTRRTDLSRLLEGRPVEEALTLLPSLFAVCGTAHTCAALDACEEALGARPEPPQAQARELLGALETLDNQAFQICVDWAQLAGLAPATRELRASRAATEQLRRWAFEEPFARLGGARIAARWVSRPMLERLEAALDPLAPRPALGGEAALRQWLKTSAEPAAGLLRAVVEAGAADFGAATAPLLPDHDARWFAPRIARAGFGAQPSLDGRAAESGAVARAAHHPAVAAMLESKGRTLLTRLLARLADVQTVGQRVAALAHTLRPSRPHPETLRSWGVGTGVADTARGRLAHQVEIHSGKVVRWLTVAPTEWTFHPLGVVQEALLGAPASDLQRRAAWLVAALDPCVACTVQVLGSRNA